jgi:hypothetical protein
MGGGWIYVGESKCKQNKILAIKKLIVNLRGAFMAKHPSFKLSQIYSLINRSPNHIPFNMA